jgi:acetyl-CoA carboxylase biotin carboxylase subunit
MIGKLIASGNDRESALARVKNALNEMVIDGVHTNIPLLRDIVVDKDFTSGIYNIHYLEKKLGL